MIIFKHFGAMRIGMAGLCLAVAFLVPEPGAATVLKWPDVITSLITPAVAPLVLMTLLLDVMMARIMASGATESERRRFRHITWFNLLLVAILISRWIPFYMALGRPV